jgi:acyl-CoA synthetase (AMP-forming)/AMP-acid ligase II
LIELVDSGSYDLSSLHRILVGGAAISESLIDRYEEHGIGVRRGRGMTEMSPSGTMSRPGTPTLQGVVVPGVELRICDEAGSELPWDSHAVGEIEARGPWVARAYHAPDDDANESRFHDGWLRTGDVGSLSPGGDLRVVDRTRRGSLPGTSRRSSCASAWRASGSWTPSSGSTSCPRRRSARSTSASCVGASASARTPAV